MTPPFRTSPSSGAPVLRGCGGDRCASGRDADRCASGRDAWPLHHVHHDGVFCRLCSSCVLLYHPTAFCSACVHLFSTDADSQDHHVDPALSPPGPITACSSCGTFVAHLSCVADPASFVCPPCAAAAESRSFSYWPAGAGRRVLDEPTARVLLIAARLAHQSIGRAAAAAREEANRCVQEAAFARKRAREMLDAAFVALEEEAREAKEKKLTPTPTSTPTQAPAPKKKTPKSSEANRERDKMLKLNAMQQPALAFAAAAAAAAAREDKKPSKPEAQGSGGRAADDDPKALFGTLQT